MKVAVVTNMVPFIRGGAEELTTHLVHHLEESGHLVDLVRLPFRWDPFSVVPAQIASAEQMRLDAADKVIAQKFPGYLVPHPNKTLWLMHQFRQAYDLFGTQHTHVTESPDDRAIRDRIVEADNAAFQASRTILTIAQTVSDRLLKHNGFASEVLLTPMLDSGLFRRKEAEPYIFAGGRINSMKRQALLIQALARTPPSVRLMIAGPPDDAKAAAELHRLAEELGVADRLSLDLRFAPREEIAELVNRATACAYLPFEGDAVGYVTVEAAEAAKPVITTDDSGGVLELVKDGRTGWVVSPDVDSIADAMTAALAKPRESDIRGTALHELWRSLDVSWPRTIERLMA
ncbi:MAG: glycosyl transferase group 1 family protein [Frondihabitans sp.]|nr:glycosyl transferase group 1 family protein [Frondihabitans sp.]